MAVKRVCDNCGKACIVRVNGFSNGSCGNMPIVDPTSKLIFDYGGDTAGLDLCADCTVQVDLSLIHI